MSDWQYAILKGNIFDLLYGRWSADASHLVILIIEKVFLQTGVLDRHSHEPQWSVGASTQYSNPIKIYLRLIVLAQKANC